MLLRNFSQHIPGYTTFRVGRECSSYEDLLGKILGVLEVGGSIELAYLREDSWCSCGQWVRGGQLTSVVARISVFRLCKGTHAGTVVQTLLSHLVYGYTLHTAVLVQWDCFTVRHCSTLLYMTYRSLSVVQPSYVQHVFL
jgi:hypothetical protein